MNSSPTSFPREKISILLLEGIHSSAIENFKRAGYTVDCRNEALSEDELLDIIPSLHILGIRSKSLITSRVIEASEHLLAIGCFCIGTNQVALDAAALRGTPVFNAPFSNTRSVAELTIAEIVMLSRRAAHKSQLLHQGVWDKSASGSHEVRGKTLGIVGYGNIGPQVGILAEALGMHVLYYDIKKVLPLGNAQPVSSLDELLSVSDFVTLHVPETPHTKLMIGKAQLERMKVGAHLLNLSRGTVVDLGALSESLRSEHLLGAAIDVFPEEPLSNDEEFMSELRGLPNVILTPHIGGSTLEAQRSIGREVSDSLIGFLETGSTVGAVNFPEVELPVVAEPHRVLNIHRNVPGALSEINRIIAETGANISAQYLSTHSEIGYLIMDVGPKLSREVKQHLDTLPVNIRTRLLF